MQRVHIQTALPDRQRLQRHAHCCAASVSPVRAWQHTTMWVGGLPALKMSCGGRSRQKGPAMLSSSCSSSGHRRATGDDTKGD